MSISQESLGELQGPDYFGLVTDEAVVGYLRTIRSLSSDNLEAMLTPAANIDPSDPATYIITKHGGLNPDTPIQRLTSYGLGVAFARALLVSALPKGAYDLPVIDSFDQSESDAKKKLVDTYLQAAGQLTMTKLRKKHLESHPVLERAITDFTTLCRARVIDLMHYGDDQLVRGCVDFFNVVTLLGAPEESRRELLRNQIGSRLMRHVLDRHSPFPRTVS